MKLPEALRFLSTTTLDEATWSLGNFGLSIGLARSAETSAEFALYSVPLGLVLLVSRLVCSYTSEPTIQVAKERRIGYLLPAAKLSGVFGLVAAAVLVLTLWLAVPKVDISAIAALGSGCVVISITETVRNIAVLAGRALPLLSLDTIWTGVILLVFSLSAAEGQPALLLWAWVVGALVGVASTWNWFLRTDEPQMSVSDSTRIARPVALRFAIEYSTAAGLGQILPLGLALLGGAGEAGDLRLVYVAFGPVTVIQLAFRQASQVIFRSRIERGEQTTRVAALLSTALLGITVAWSAVLLTLGRHFGGAILGGGWQTAWRLVPLAALAQCVIVVASPAGSLSRAMLLIAPSVRLRTFLALLLVPCATIGSWASGASGLLGANLAINVLAGVLFWRLVLTADSSSIVGGAELGGTAR